MKKWILGKEENSVRNGYIWNLIASAVNAAEAVVILMLTTRFAGIENAGILTISFTVANLMMCIGKYGVRSYQVTDYHENKHLQSYFYSRIITVGIMIFFTVIFLACSVLFSNYFLYKILIVFLTMGLYAIEAVEDVFLAEFQRRGRLDIGAKMFSIRWIGTLFIWGVLIIIFKSVLIPTLFAFIFDMVLFMILTLSISKDLYEKAESKKGKEIKKIMIDCLPLCIVAVLTLYLPNAAKYAIDMWLNDEIQAYYGFIAMPIFVIDLISFVIFQPSLKGLSEKWEKMEYKEFAIGIAKLFLVVLGVSVVCMVLGYFLGIPVLNILYAVDISGYKFEFMILLIAGSAQAYIGLFIAILIIFRKQGFMLIPFFGVSIGVFLALNLLVSKHGIRGATVINVIGMIILATLLFAEIIIIGMLEMKNAKNEIKGCSK